MVDTHLEYHIHLQPNSIGIKERANFAIHLNSRLGKIALDDQTCTTPHYFSLNSPTQKIYLHHPLDYIYSFALEYVQDGI